jgi:hypothetical protein
VAKEEYWPRLLANDADFTPLTNYVGTIPLATSVLAFIVLWFRRRSVLDLWVAVAILAMVSVLIYGAFDGLSRGKKSLGRVNDRYYCCHQAVWYDSAAPTGPWTVCASVPPAIYTLPPSCPSYHVRYVYVYDYGYSF